MARMGEDQVELEPGEAQRRNSLAADREPARLEPLRPELAMERERAADDLGVERARERRVVPIRSRGSSVVALAILAAFVATCVVLFGGYKLGLRQPSPFEKAAENITAVPTPAAPVER